MTIRLLRTLVAVAEAKTFSAAARRVHVTHAAVSQQMQALEAEMGVQLFNRDSRTPELTPLGQQVVIKARDVISAYDNIIPSVLAEDGLGGTLHLGAMPTTLTGLAPRAMAVLTNRHPEIGLRIRPGLTNPLIADVARGTLDAAIVSQPHLMPLGLRFRALAQEKLHLIVSAVEREDDVRTLLCNRPFIRFNRNAVMGTLIDNWLREHRYSVHDAMELDSPEAVVSMVHENLGVSILPDLVVAPPGRWAVKRLALGADAPERRVGLVQMETSAKTRTLDAVYAALQHVIAQAQLENRDT